MQKFPRLLFLTLVLITCFQLTGLEEAFCEDSAMEAGCQDCATCAEHQFIGFIKPASPPTLSFSGYPFLDYSFQPLENAPLNLLRPPIAR